MCIFCKIISGEIPASKIYEDEFVLAFLDISQVTKGHTLIVPKKHCENIYCLSDDCASKLLVVSKKIATALKHTFNLEGLNLVNNNESLSGQTVNHFHIHLIPRYVGDEFKLEFKQNPPDFNQLKQTQEEILKHL